MELTLSWADPGVVLAQRILIGSLTLAVLFGVALMLVPDDGS